MTADAWWWELTADERRRLDQAAQTAPVEPRHHCYPYWSAELATEVLAWSLLWDEILTAHILWLLRLKDRADAAGRIWDRAEFLRQCEVDDA